MATVGNVTGLAEQAYVLGYPLVLTDRIMAQSPVNQLVHAREEPDTLRSSGWLDLADPIVLAQAFADIHSARGKESVGHAAADYQMIDLGH